MGAAVGQPDGRSRGRRGRKTMRPMSEINVTPFVDVMLVLLIIFMVAAPLLTVGVEVDLAETDAPSLPQEPAEPLVVTVDATGTVFLQEQAVPSETLLARLAAIAELRAEDRVYVRAAGEVVHARVAEVMGALSAAGFRRIALVNEQRAADGG
ncbi:MAG: ExbD/TolR family protein [Pseudomonadota bacterium]